MRKMTTDFLALNYGWLLLAVFGVTLGVGVAYFAITKMRTPTPVPVVPTTISANFADDPVASSPVMANNPHYNIFYDATQAAIYYGINPWDYLRGWEKAKEFKGVEPALLDFITNEAHRQIPDSSKITLSIRDYSDPNSVMMEYCDPATQKILATTGHDPEPALYATFANKKDSVTFKLVCANGLVRETGGKVTSFHEDYEIGIGDSFIGITGATPHQAVRFAGENNLPVRFIIEGMVEAKTPDFSKVEVFEHFKNFRKGILDVTIQPGYILRKQEKNWLYLPPVSPAPSH